MDKQEERERQIINLTSKLPSKRLLKRTLLCSVVLLILYLNYSLVTAEVFNKTGLLEFLGMNSIQANQANIPNYYSMLVALVIVLDVICTTILFMFFGPTIGKTIKVIWNKFPD